jgi:uncharacterized protein
MPVNPTYPGIYLEELPSSSRTITAAPTSITVFVGYTHPFKTQTFNEAIEIFNFTEYESKFGGLYESGIIDSYLPYSINQFFINGGSVAYVIGLSAKCLDINGGDVANGNIPLLTGGTIIAAPKLTVGTGTEGIIFTALEPTDSIPMKVTINNLKPAENTADIADIIITYGSQVETYRGVTIKKNLDGTEPNNYIEKKLGTKEKPISSLVAVSPASGGYGATITFDSPAQKSNNPIEIKWKQPNGFATTFLLQDFTDVFKENSSLDKVSIFNLLLIPGIAADNNSIWSAALAFCERKQAFAILDPPIEAAADESDASLPVIAKKFENVPQSKNGAIYFPYLKSTDILTGKPKELPPSGYVAGIYAKTDLNRGVWKAPAGLETTLLSTTGVVDRGRMTDQRQGTLNPIGINCLRSFPGVGTVVYGARTLVSANVAFEQSKYVPVRRMTLFIKQTLYRNLGWVVFEPNDEPLWVAIRTSIESFMLSLFNQGAFQGSTPSQAFQVKCDKSTTTQQDINNGIVNIIVAFAPLKPAEFVIVKIAQLAGQVQS